MEIYEFSVFRALETLKKDEIPDNDSIYGDDFKVFLELCFSHSNYFTLSCNPGLTMLSEGGYSSFIPEFDKYLVKSIERWQWFAHEGSSIELCRENKNFLVPIKINIYKVCLETKKLLLKYYNDIFLQSFPNEYNLSRNNRIKYDLNIYENGRYGYYGTVTKKNEFPKDLCFFQNEKLIFGSNSFQQIAQFYNPKEEIKKELENHKKYGYWKLSNHDYQRYTIDVPTANPKMYSMSCSNLKKSLQQEYFKELLIYLLENSFSFTLSTGYSFDPYSSFLPFKKMKSY